MYGRDLVGGSVTAWALYLVDQPPFVAGVFVSPGGCCLLVTMAYFGTWCDEPVDLQNQFSWA